MVNELPSFVPDLSGAKFVQAGPITHANVSLHILIIAYLTPLHYLTLLRMEPAPRAISNPTICINLSDFVIFMLQTEHSQNSPLSIDLDKSITNHNTPCRLDLRTSGRNNNRSAQFDQFDDSVEA